MATTTTSKTAAPDTSAAGIAKTFGISTTQAQTATNLLSGSGASAPAGTGTTANGGDYTVSADPSVTAANAQKAANVASGKNPDGTPMAKPATPATPALPADTNNPVNSSKPSPSTASATPYTGGSIVDALSNAGLPSTLADRGRLAGQYGMVNYTGTADQNAKMLEKFRAAHAAAQASGSAAPSTNAGGRSGASGFADTAAASQDQGNPVVNSLVNSDPYIAQYQKAYQDYMNPSVQRQSLTEEYKSLMKDSGLPEINTELMNMKNVINGTEEDIRNEVTKAGGFATESQVLALTSARNKQVIKNYNNLLEVRNQKQEYVNTMIGLDEKDRTEVDSRFDKAMNFTMQMANYGEKMQSNARDSYQKIVDRVGYAGLYKSTGGDPHYAALIEKTLGLQGGELAKIAQTPDIDRMYKEAEIAKMNNPLDRQLKAAQIANEYSQIRQRQYEMGDIQGGGAATVNGQNYSPSDVAYAQQYASTGAVPTGLPKGSFGRVAGIAMELPKPAGTMVDMNTGVKSGKLDATQSAGVSALYDLTKKLDTAKTMFDGLNTGVAAGLTKTLFYTKAQQQYDDLKGEIVDLLARARSGAQLNEEEINQYNKKLPGRFNNALGLGSKGSTSIQDLKNSIEGKLQTTLQANGLSIYGYSKVKVGGTEYTVGDLIANEKGQQGRVNPDGSITPIK